MDLVCFQKYAMYLPSFHLLSLIMSYMSNYVCYVMDVFLFELISFLPLSLSLCLSPQSWPCMKTSSSAQHPGAQEEVMSTATVAPTGGTST